MPKRFAAPKISRRAAALTIAAAAAIAIVTATANWRLALLAALAGAAIALTRMRYSAVAALATLAAIAALAATGHTAGADQQAQATTRACGAVTASSVRLTALRAQATSCRRARTILRSWARDRRSTIDGYRCNASPGTPTVIACTRAQARVTARRS